MQRRAFISVISVLLVTVGCSSSQNAAAIIAQMNDSNGKRLANLYAIHQARHGWVGPANKAAFVKFIQKDMHPTELAGTGVDPGSLDSLFVSERDKEPFFIRYGVEAPSWAVSRQAVVFEEKGAGGRIAVFMTGPKVIEVSAGEIEAYREGKKDEVPPKPVSGPPAGNKR
jgi:hypothetical protein